MLHAKTEGGLGILNLYLFYKALLAKWIWKMENEYVLWQDILLNKYVKGKCISRSHIKLESQNSGPVF